VSDERLTVVVGPTASGKSALAVELCRRLGGEVVNADAVQLFRGMDIGSAKTPPHERAGVPHHLLDVLDVTDEANAALFQAQARAAIEDVRGRGASPMLVGGSSLYVRAVIDSLEFPGADPAVRAHWTAELDRVGPIRLHALLAERDPDAAAAILPTNGRRVVRALEVNTLTGRPFAATMPGYASIYPRLAMIGLDVPRAELDERIDHRVDRMWSAGFIDEVRRLKAAGIERSLTASRALGYQQALAFLRGDLDEAQARSQTKTGTRKFARRQDRMFRKDPRIAWLPYDASDLVERAERLVSSA